MPKRRIAIELVFEDDFALLDFQEKGLDLDLLGSVAEWVDDQMGDRVTVPGDYLEQNNQTKEWRQYGLNRAPRPSELAMAAVDRKNHPDKTHWELARERLEKQEADREERRRKDREFAARMQAQEEYERRIMERYKADVDKAIKEGRPAPFFRRENYERVGDLELFNEEG